MSWLTCSLPYPDRPIPNDCTSGYDGNYYLFFQENGYLSELKYPHHRDQWRSPRCDNGKSGWVVCFFFFENKQPAPARGLVDVGWKPFPFRSCSGFYLLARKSGFPESGSRQSNLQPDKCRRPASAIFRTTIYRNRGEVLPWLLLTSSQGLLQIS